MNQCFNACLWQRLPCFKTDTKDIDKETQVGQLLRSGIPPCQRHEKEQERVFVFVCVTMETIVVLGGVTLWPIHIVNKTFIEAEECYGFCVSVHACAGKHACVWVREWECECVSFCLWCWASCSDPTECTILSANKGPTVPPHFNRGLLQHRQPLAAELTKYFPSCTEFVSINRFVFWGFLLWFFAFDRRLLNTQVAA